MLALEKLIVFFFIFSILIILKEVLTFALLASSAARNKREEKVTYSWKRLLILGIAISYFFTMIFTGFKI